MHPTHNGAYKGSNPFGLIIVIKLININKIKKFKKLIWVIKNTLLDLNQ